MAVDLTNYSEPGLNRYLHNRARIKGVPLAGNFELTPCCNLNCKMCYVRKDPQYVRENGGLIPAEQWLDWGREAADRGMLFLLLTGGEPLVHPQFKEIYTGLKKLGLMISLNTNGTLIDREMVEFLAADAPTRINISLYGGSLETYARLCGDASAYERAMWAIRALCEKGINVKLNFSATPSNAADIADVYRVAEECGARVQATAYMFPAIRRGYEFKPYDRFLPEQAGREMVENDRLRYTAEQFAARADAVKQGVFVADPEKECMDQPDEHISCRAGRSSFWMTWDGKMAPCGMMTQPQVDVRNVGFSSAWAEIRRASEELYLPPKCAACPARVICPVCVAACFAETGSYHTAPPYLCETTAAYLKMLGASAPNGKETEL